MASGYLGQAEVRSFLVPLAKNYLLAPVSNGTGLEPRSDRQIW